jgi:hypothetical protein
VSAVLFEIDPMGINFESNTDEYEPEAGTIIPRLGQASTVQDVEALIHEEFCHWFGAEWLVQESATERPQHEFGRYGVSSIRRFLARKSGR